MFLDRPFSLLSGIAGAILASQLPGFTLQYMQNLNGRIDELQPIVDEFEVDVMKYNYTVEEALDECLTATGLFDALCDSFEDIIIRYEDLLQHYQTLDTTDEYRRPFVLMGSVRTEIVESVWEEFEVAVPASNHGFVYAGCGFLAFFSGIFIVLCILNYMYTCCCSSSSKRRTDNLQAAVTGIEGETSSPSDHPKPGFV